MEIRRRTVKKEQKTFLCTFTRMQCSDSSLLKGSQSHLFKVILGGSDKDKEADDRGEVKPDLLLCLLERSVSKRAFLELVWKTGAFLLSYLSRGARNVFTVFLFSKLLFKTFIPFKFDRVFL